MAVEAAGSVHLQPGGPAFVPAESICTAGAGARLPRSDSTCTGCGTYEGRVRARPEPDGARGVVLIGARSGGI